MSSGKSTCSILASLLLGASAAACGNGGDDHVDYPPFPEPTKAIDAAPRPDSEPPPPPGPATPLINEFARSDDGSPDTKEFVEIIGDPSTDYSAYAVLIVEGDGGSTLGNVTRAFALGTTDASGFFATPTGPDDPTDDDIQNGSQTFLLVKDFTGNEGDDLDDAGGAGDIGDGTLDHTPWSEVIDAVAVSDGGATDVFYVTIDSTTYGNTLSLDTSDGGASRIPDGTDSDMETDWVIGPDSGVANDATESNATPGASNSVGT